jgi:hypothetical protein
MQDSIREQMIASSTIGQQVGYTGVPRRIEFLSWLDASTSTQASSEKMATMTVGGTMDGLYP